MKDIECYNLNDNKLNEKNNKKSKIDNIYESDKEINENNKENMDFKSIINKLEEIYMRKDSKYDYFDNTDCTFMNSSYNPSNFINTKNKIFDSPNNTKVDIDKCEINKNPKNKNNFIDSKKFSTIEESKNKNYDISFRNTTKTNDNENKSFSIIDNGNNFNMNGLFYKLYNENKDKNIEEIQKKIYFLLFESKIS